MTTQPSTLDEKTRKLLDRLLTGALALVGLGMACAMYFSGWAMWHTVDDKFDLAGDWTLILPIFGLFDILATAFALLAAYNMVSKGERGVPYALLWAFVALSGIMSASDADNNTARFMRFMAPVVAAIAFEVLLSAKRHSLAGTKGALQRAWIWFKARRGWLDALDADEQTAARRATAGKLATLRWEIDQRKTETRRRSRAERKYLAEVRRANERQGFANDPEMVGMFRVALASLYGAIDDTRKDDLRDASPWKRKPEAEVPPSAAEVQAAPTRKPSAEVSAPAENLAEARAEVPPTVSAPAPAAEAEIPAEAPPAVSAPVRTVAAPARRQPERAPVPVAAHGAGNGRVRGTREDYQRLITEQPNLTTGKLAEVLRVSDRTIRNWRNDNAA